MNIKAGLEEITKMAKERIGMGTLTSGSLESSMRVKFSDLRRVLAAMDTCDSNATITMKGPVKKGEPYVEGKSLAEKLVKEGCARGISEFMASLASEHYAKIIEAVKELDMNKIMDARRNGIEEGKRQVRAEINGRLLKYWKDAHCCGNSMDGFFILQNAIREELFGPEPKAQGG